MRNKPLFQVFAEQLLFHGKKAGRAIPWYIMTSDANDARHAGVFSQTQNSSAASPSLSFFFQQGMMPAFGMDGKLLLLGRPTIHARALPRWTRRAACRALEKSGESGSTDMRKRGVEHLSYFQVDNPLVHIVDLALPWIARPHRHLTKCPAKPCPRRTRWSRVGNFVMGDGMLQVIEYSDLPESLARPDRRRWHAKIQAAVPSACIHCG